MITLSLTATVMLGALMALWLAGAIWAIATGWSMRRVASRGRTQADRLAALLESAPAIPVLVRADGRVEAPERLRQWLGKAAMPAFISEVTAADGGLTPDSATAFANDLVAAQRAGKSFTRPLAAANSHRTMLARGAPANPLLAAPGGVMLWIFDVTESQSEIAQLTGERDGYRDALSALSTLVEAAPMPMWLRGPDMRLSLVNSAYVHAVEAQDAAQVVLEGVELLEAQDGMAPDAAARTAAHEGRKLTRMVPATVRSERRSVQVVDVPVGEAGVAGFAIDMQELEEARTEYRRLVHAQRDMLDRLSSAVAQFGPDRGFQFANQSFFSLFGLDIDHLTAEPEFERVLDRMRDAGKVPESRDYPAWRVEHGNWFRRADPVEDNWLLPDGTHLRVLAQPLPDGGLLLIFEDRTEQIQLSSARDTLLRVRTATFDNLFEAIGVFASDGRLSLWNSRFRRIWGLEEEQLAKHPRIDQLITMVTPLLSSVSQAGTVRELVRSATVERKQRAGRVIFADGRHFEFAAIPLPDGNALFTMLDVSDSRRMEQALRDRNEALEEADRVKTGFVSSMSYELRTPLTSIAGFAEMLDAGYAGDLGAQAKDYVSAILESTQRLSGLIDDVLDLTAGEAGGLPLERSPVELRVVAEEVLARYRPIAEQKKIELAVTMLPTLGKVDGDRRRIGQALDHLLSNAMRYTPEGGRVLVHGDGHNRAARLVVSDNGPGMDQREQDRAFDRFSRAGRVGHGEALGIGLPLARQYVEAHGGTLTLVSRPGEGTAVAIELPRK